MNIMIQTNIRATDEMFISQTDRPSQPLPSPTGILFIYRPHPSLPLSFPSFPFHQLQMVKGGEEEQLNVAKLNRQQQIPFNHHRRSPSFPTTLTRDYIIHAALDASIYSTVTDLARFRGKSTLRPSMTANQ